MSGATDRLDRSFTTMFIIISVFNVGLILSMGVRLGETSPAANSAAITQSMIPIMMLVVVWWIAEFYDSIPFKLGGWTILFTLVFYAFVFLMITLGVDRYLGFDVIYLVIGYILTPFPALIVVSKIKNRYSMLLNRGLTKMERNVTIVLVTLFMLYWLFVPWDLTAIGLPWWP